MGAKLRKSGPPRETKFEREALEFLLKPRRHLRPVTKFFPKNPVNFQLFDGFQTGSYLQQSINFCHLNRDTRTFGKSFRIYA